MSTTKKTQPTQWKVQSTFVPGSTKQFQHKKSDTTQQPQPQSSSQQPPLQAPTPTPAPTIITPTPMPSSFSSYSAFTPPSDPSKAIHRSVSPHIIQQKYPKGQKPIGTLSVREDMRMALLKKAYALARFPAPDDPRVSGLPAALHRYTAVFRMDSAKPRKIPVLGFPTACYRAMSSVDGNVYAVRQVANIKSFTEPMKLVYYKKHTKNNNNHPSE